MRIVGISLLLLSACGQAKTVTTEPEVPNAVEGTVTEVKPECQVEQKSDGVLVRCGTNVIFVENVYNNCCKGKKKDCK